MAKILIVEDNKDLAEGLAANLRLEGHVTEICSDGDSVLQDTRKWNPDLIILDIMLPNRDGFSVLKAIRAHNHSVPILMLTARGEETDKVRALRGGADDYITKPFGLMELLARVEALFRRSPGNLNAAQTPETGFGDVRIDCNTQRVWKGDQQVVLTPKEYELLLTLLAQPNRVHTREDLLRKVWKHRGDIATRTVDTHMAELRRKLELDSRKPKYLRTARGSGYWLKCEKPSTH